MTSGCEILLDRNYLNWIVKKEKSIGTFVLYFLMLWTLLGLRRDNYGIRVEDGSPLRVWVRLLAKVPHCLSEWCPPLHLYETFSHEAWCHVGKVKPSRTRLHVTPKEENIVQMGLPPWARKLSYNFYLKKNEAMDLNIE